MPAKSESQRRLFAVAEHAPGKLYRKNGSLLSLSHATLHDFASTPEKGLPMRAKKSKKKSKHLLRY